MKIKPRTWDFSTDFCCYEFSLHATDDNSSPAEVDIYTNGKKVSFRGVEITNCPFCGKKITLEREGC
jgi:hypothetical protein